MTDLAPGERREAVVNPGEVVYVLSEEKINMPLDMYMHLSANRGMSEYGVLTLGGFAVDPGYKGRLMFGLYNYSSTPFTLIPGAKLVGGLFYQLSQQEAGNIDNFQPPKAINDFPPNLIAIIGKYSPVGMNSLEKMVKNFKEQIDQFKDELNQNRYQMNDLRRTVQDAQEQTNKMSHSVNDLFASVEQLKSSIGELTKGLQSEMTIRGQVEENLKKEIELSAKKTNDKISFLKGAAWLATAFGSVVVALLIAWITGWLKFPVS